MQELEVVREKIQNKYRVVKTDEDLEWNRAIYLCTNIINAHLSRENDPEIARSSRDNDGWIPVEERLPTTGECEKDNNEFLVQTNTGERFSCEYDPLANGFDNPLWCCNVPVVAWRLLPEPYRPERSEG